MRTIDEVPTKNKTGNPFPHQGMPLACFGTHPPVILQAHLPMQPVPAANAR